MMLKRTTPLKKSNIPLKRNGTFLKKTRMQTKTPDPKYLADRKAGGEKMMLLFEQHWNSKPHVCESCGCKIYGENKTIYHDHLLEKGLDRYAHLKFEIENLYLVCLKCHTDKGNGFPSISHKEAIETAKERFNII